LAGDLEARPQDDALSSYVGQVSKGDAEIDWTADAEAIWRMVRAYNPWPGAATTMPGARLHIWQGWPVGHEPEAEPGTVLSLSPVDTADGQRPALHVRCGVGSLAILQLQKEGRRILGADEFTRGERGIIGSVLGRGA
jgi:methionyl-tRNA formyltransferase